MHRNVFLLLVSLASFLVFLVDTQLTTLVTNLLPGFLSASSYILFIYSLFLSTYLYFTQSLFLFVLIGALFDIFYLKILGFSTSLFPLLLIGVYYFLKKLHHRPIIFLMIFIVMVFVFEFTGFLFARLLRVTNLSMYIFAFYHLVPTLVVNSILFLLIHPLFSKIFGITNKT